MLMRIKNKYVRNMTNFLMIFFLVFLARFIPHPPNFTIIIALTFYVSLYFNYKSSLYLLISFVISDVILGLHNLVYITWSSILIISLNSQKFSRTCLIRFCGVISSVLFFYFMTSIGVYLFADHGNEDLIKIFSLGIPFMINSLLCSLLFAIVVEIYIFYRTKIRLLI
jgi:hypothetical protein